VKQKKTRFFNHLFNIPTKVDKIILIGAVVLTLVRNSILSFNDIILDFVLGVEASSRTRQTTYYVQRHARVKCGYSDCGLFGWSSCTRWCDNYWAELQNGVETYMVYQQRTCPVTNLVCCAGFITVINHCFTYEEILNNKDVLEILVAMGIPINPTMG